MRVASLRAVAGALSFLTIVPIGRVVTVDARDVARGLILFPVVGAGVGALTAGIAVGLHSSLPAFVAAGVAVAGGVIATGALHVDALADTADAAGAGSRERALEIMRDSRIGAFGAAAVALDLLLKVAAIAALLGGDATVTTLVAAGALSRAASPPLASLLPYPRAGGGAGSLLKGVPLLQAGAAVVLGVALAALAVGGDALWLAATAGVVALVLGLLCRFWLGGATGDCLGAVTELAETTVLIVAVGLA